MCENYNHEEYGISALKSHTKSEKHLRNTGTLLINVGQFYMN